MFMNSRGRKFLSYYRPYRGLLAADLACAFVIAAVTLTLPLCARYIIKNILEGSAPNAMSCLARPRRPKILKPLMDDLDSLPS